MKKYKINKQNWTGEMGTYTVDGNKVKVGNTTYTTQLVINTGYGTRWVEVYLNGRKKHWTVSKLPDGNWTAKVMAVEREGNTPDEVIARLHWNIVDAECIGGAR